MSDEKKYVVGQKCPDCGFKIRGPRHCEGKHHREGKNGKIIQLKR